MSKEAARWIHAWSPAIGLCSPLALDLANHERGRHDTHRYVSYAVLVHLFRPNVIPTNSLVMFMEPTGLDEDCQLYRVRNSPSCSAPSCEA